MLAPFIGQVVVCLANKTYITAYCVHVLPLLSLMGLIAPVKSELVLIIVHDTIMFLEQSHKMCEFSIGVP